MSTAAIRSVVMSDSDEPELLTAQLLIRLTPSQYEALSDAAQRQRRPMRTLARMIIEDWLETHS